MASAGLVYPDATWCQNRHELQRLSCRTCMFSPAGAIPSPDFHSVPSKPQTKRRRWHSIKLKYLTAVGADFSMRHRGESCGQRVAAVIKNRERNN